MAIKIELILCLCFPLEKAKLHSFRYVENPQINNELIYNYRGVETKALIQHIRVNSVYVTGKIIKKIGPILCYKEQRVYSNVCC